MGQKRIVIMGLLFIAFVSVLLSVPSVRKSVIEITKTIADTVVKITNLSKNNAGSKENAALDDSDNKDKDKYDNRDKELCGKCHSDKNRDFSMPYKHSPFVNWHCTDCHVEHKLGDTKYEYVVDINKLCTSCHFDRNNEHKQPNQHPPFAKGQCIDCHDPHASEYPLMLRLPVEKLCTSCHNVEKEYSFSNEHPPFKKGYCVDCHSPHASPNEKLTKLPGKQLCFTCHFDRMNELHSPVTHKPFVEGECANCHGPHGSNNQSLLLLPPEELCFSCHKDKKADSLVGYQHKPFVTGRCIDCHVPHGSNNNALTKAPRSDLCYMCHSQYKTFFADKPSHHPVGNGMLECYSCHNPHSGPAPKMLPGKGNATCYKCHIGLKDGFEKIAHATKATTERGTGLCINCHIPHGSDNKPLLRQPVNDLCTSCHGKTVKAGFSHPVGIKYKDKWRGGMMTCVSCHGPHGTGYPKFVRKTRDGLCITCHQDPRNKNIVRKRTW